jgi:hypothetical protein
MDKSVYDVTLKLNDGASYTLSKLGYDTSIFIEKIEGNIRALRDRTIAVLKELDLTLSTTQAAQLSKLIPEGAAASMGAIASIAPSFAAALEKRIMGTRAASSYAVFKELCDPANIWVGFKKKEARDEEPSEEEEEEEQSDYLFWMIAPSPCGKYVAVEFGEENTATFVSRTDTSKCIAGQLNRALEAINFRREVIRLTDEELRKPEYAVYYMAAKRTSSLQFIRKNFVARIIHSNPEAWKRKLLETWSGGRTEQSGGGDGTKFCGTCGAPLEADKKFCGGCGAKL